jgi:copper(I)-binding protein
MTRPFFRSTLVAARSRTARLPALDGRLGLLAVTLLLLMMPTRALLAHEFKIGDLEIKHPWSRAAPQGAKVAAGYLVVVNTGTAPDRLVSVTAEIAGVTEIHEMAVNAEGVMTMRPLDAGLEIPAGAELALKPGGYHIMLMDLKRLPRVDEKFAGTLTFEKAGTVAIEFAVESMAGGAAAHGDHTAN